MSGSSIHNYLGRLDFEKPHGRDLGDMPREQKNNVVAHNAYHASLETLNAIPGISVVSGMVTMGAGVCELFGSGSLNGGLSDHAGAAVRGGLKMIALGALATFAPGVGNVINAVVAATDAIDALNAAG